MLRRRHDHLGDRFAVYAHACAARLPPENRYVRFQGHALPPRVLRHCGADFQNDAYFVQSAVEEAERPKKVLGLGPGSRILEVGCGPGRIAIGLLYASYPVGRYDGVDVDRRAIEWCKRFISRSHPEYHFRTIDVKNERYNPHGSEMTTAFTAFVEEGVPPVTVNPENYVMECVGPLHIIRYEKGHLFSIFESCGFEVERFDHGHRGQTAERHLPPAAGRPRRGELQ